jgi:hypothetical protein
LHYYLLLIGFQKLIQGHVSEWLPSLFPKSFSGCITLETSSTLRQGPLYQISFLITLLLTPVILSLVPTSVIHPHMGLLSLVSGWSRVSSFPASQHLL